MYNAKDKELEESRGQPYVAQRNLSAQAKAYHEENLSEHKETRSEMKSETDRLQRQSRKTQAQIADLKAVVLAGSLAWATQAHEIPHRARGGSAFREQAAVAAGKKGVREWRGE